MQIYTLERLGSYSHFERSFFSGDLHYCKKCMEAGFHSYLHELSWLSRCPFHDQPILRAPLYTRSNSRIETVVEALKMLMRRKCPMWPWTKEKNASKWDMTTINRLQQWIFEARMNTLPLSIGELWRSRMIENDWGGRLAELVGQLRSLTPVADELGVYFKPASGRWNLDIYRFPIEAKRDYYYLTQGLGFELILNLYVYISAHSKNPPPFQKKLKNTIEKFRKRHSPCLCKWGQGRGSWDHYYWVQIDPRDQPLSMYACPFEVALRELEIGWGRADLKMSDRMAEKEYRRAVNYARDLYLRGAVSYTSNALVSNDGRLIPYPKADPFCEWTFNSPFTDLLNTFAECEIEAREQQLIAWLNGIENGDNPHTRIDKDCSVRLCASEEGMSVINWRRNP